MVEHLDALARFLLQDDVLDVSADCEHRLKSRDAVGMVVIEGHLLLEEYVKAEVDGVIGDRLLPFKPVGDPLE